jgi:hypothetical protein
VPEAIHSCAGLSGLLRSKAPRNDGFVVRKYLKIKRKFIMKHITTQDLKESLTLLLPQKHDDGEGGWREEWERGPHLWAFLWPLIGKEDTPCYRIVIRAGLILPSKIAFLWHLYRQSKRLSVFSTPVLFQYNRFISMTAKEVTDA